MKRWRPLRDRFRSHKERTVDPLTGYNRWAKEYANQNNPVLELEGRTLKKLLPDLSGKDSLDIGCGTGRVTRILTERNAARVTAVDFSMNMLNEARKRLRGTGRTQLAGAEALALPFGDDSFDLVTCSLMASHVESLQPFVAELARVARPGSHLLISEFHPFGHLVGWKRSFVDGCGPRAERLSIRYHRHMHEDYFRAFKNEDLQIEELREPCIDESVKHFFEGSRSDFANYRRFFGCPLVLFFKLKARQLSTD